eukprot:CAMPEP_0113821482 /NCGR_PEP_ID=MMETSP0328-20130328/1760_1 /TAXON_ID=39455 /ORGANISM="Alexandrium minutum" /LENGTH=60 /DNA_ID=CAMNT_0000789413 /DNA_START=172 /DNA_END=355 /DNA_ORIENTATION=- /assembly_acc=CAM_ASM_000350
MISASSTEASLATLGMAGETSASATGVTSSARIASAAFAGTDAALVFAPPFMKKAWAPTS